MVMPAAIGIFKTPFDGPAVAGLRNAVDTFDFGSRACDGPNKVILVVCHTDRTTVIDSDKVGIAIVSFGCPASIAFLGLCGG